MSRLAANLVRIFTVLLPSTSCCTYFETPDGSSTSPGKIVTRSMEYYNLLGVTNWQMVTHPRGTTYHQGITKTGTVKHGHVSIESNGILPGLVGDGMNDEGLSISCQVFYASAYADYKLFPSRGHNQLLFSNVARWALSEFGTTSDLVGNLSMMTVSHLPLHLGKDLANVGIHWAVTDALGDSRVIECTNGTGKCQVYSNNEVGVLTNDPEYPWMVTNLNNYAFLSPNWVLDNNKKIQVKTPFGMVPSSKSAGFNLRGLPGDSTPPSRFVKVFYEREYALLNDKAQLKEIDDYMFLAQSVMNSVFIPKGVEANEHPMLLPIEYSQWAVMKLPKRKEIFVRSYDDMQWRHIDLNNLSLAEGDASLSFLVEASNQKFQDVVKPATWTPHAESSMARNQTSSQDSIRELPPLV